MRLIVLERENRPPRMAVDKPLVDLERPPQGIELLDKARNIHEGGIGEPIRFARAELIVADDWPVVAEVLERLQVIAARSRPTMHKYHRQSLAGARHAIPDA